MVRFGPAAQIAYMAAGSSDFHLVSAGLGHARNAERAPQRTASCQKLSPLSACHLARGPWIFWLQVGRGRGQVDIVLPLLQVENLDLRSSVRNCAAALGKGSNTKDVEWRANPGLTEHTCSKPCHDSKKRPLVCPEAAAVALAPKDEIAKLSRPCCVAKFETPWRTQGHRVCPALELALCHGHSFAQPGAALSLCQEDEEAGRRSVPKKRS